MHRPDHQRNTITAMWTATLSNSGEQRECTRNWTVLNALRGYLRDHYMMCTGVIIDIDYLMNKLQYWLTCYTSGYDYLHNAPIGVVSKPHKSEPHLLYTCNHTHTLCINYNYHDNKKETCNSMTLSW